MAKEFNLHVMMVSSLSREARGKYKSDYGYLSTLRDSGAIEYEADVVTFLVPGDEEGTVRLEVEKNRNGPVGTVMLSFFKQILRFESYYDGKQESAYNVRRPPTTDHGLGKRYTLSDEMSDEKFSNTDKAFKVKNGSHQTTNFMSDENGSLSDEEIKEFKNDSNKDEKVDPWDLEEL